MSRFLLSRLWQTLLVLLVMSFVIYGLIGLMPGDPIDLMMASNPGMTPEAAARLRAIYGLDQPLLFRYLHWLQAAVQGNLGYSRVHARPVLEVMGPALWQTTKLMLGGFTLAVLLSLVLGTLAALRPGGWLDGAVSTLALAGVSVPVFWLALIFILVFAQTLRWLPASGVANVGDGGLADVLRHLLLPVLTLALSTAGQFVRYVRAAMVDVLRMDHVRTARAKGAGEGRVVRAHALRNAMIPVVTVVALSFGTLFGGALITETMFAQPGLGKMIYDSILGNDYNLALAGLLFATLVTLASNVLADLAYGWLDPRISLA